MDEDIARDIIRHALLAWRSKPFSELVQLIDRSHTSEVAGPDSKTYQIEILVFWDSRRSGNIRVMGAVDDGGRRAFKPLTESFIMTPSGQFVDED